VRFCEWQNAWAVTAGVVSVAKLNLILLFLAIACALGVVTSQHKARKLFIELQKEQEESRKMEVEWGQLQLEQSTWATPSRVEKIASRQLQMQTPKNEKIQFVRLQQAANK
jgi:cell division protein FtsL